MKLLQQNNWIEFNLEQVYSLKRQWHKKKQAGVRMESWKMVFSNEESPACWIPGKLVFRTLLTKSSLHHEEVYKILNKKKWDKSSTKNCFNQKNSVKKYEVQEKWMPVTRSISAKIEETVKFVWTHESNDVQPNN